MVLAHEAAQSGLSRYSSINAFYNALFHEGNITKIAEIDGVVVGVLLLRFGDHCFYSVDSQSMTESQNVSEIHSGYVRKSASGRGVFRDLFAAQVEAAVSIGRPVFVEPRSMDEGQDLPTHYHTNRECWVDGVPDSKFRQFSLVRPLVNAEVLVNHPYGTATVRESERHGFKFVGINPYDNCPVYCKCSL